MFTVLTHVYPRVTGLTVPVIHRIDRKLVTFKSRKRV